MLLPIATAAVAPLVAPSVPTLLIAAVLVAARIALHRLRGRGRYGLHRCRS